MKKTFFLLVSVLLIFCNITYGQDDKFELQVGSSFWLDKNNKQKPEKQYNLYLNENVKLGYKLWKYISVGLSTNYTFKKYYSKGKHVMVSDDRFLFETCTIKEKNFEIGPYVKFSIGENLKLSFASEYNYSFGNVRSEILTEHRVSYFTVIDGDLDFTSSLVFIELSIGKKIIENFYINAFIKKRYVFVKKYETGSIGEPYSQNYLGIQLSYFLNL